MALLAGDMFAGASKNKYATKQPIATRREISMADLKDCPFGFDIKNDCKNCDYSDTNHYDPATGKCIKR